MHTDMGAGIRPSQTPLFCPFSIGKFYLNILSSIYCQHLSVTKAKRAFLRLSGPAAMKASCLGALFPPHKRTLPLLSVWETVGYATGNGMLLIS